MGHSGKRSVMHDTLLFSRFLVLEIWRRWTVTRTPSDGWLFRHRWHLPGTLQFKAERPTGAVTFLFTDVEGSTQA